LLEGRGLLEMASLPLCLPWLQATPRGDGHPVLLVPGFAATDATLVGLWVFLRSRGYHVETWGFGQNTGFQRKFTQALEQKLRHMHHRHGRKVSLVGWSLGGVYAFYAAHCAPECVRSVVSLGGPMRVTADTGQVPLPVKALYRYFATKDELVNALLDRVLGRVELGTDSEDWSRDLADLAEAHRTVLAAHPWAVTVLFSHPSPGDNAARFGERLLHLLDRGGIRGEDAVAAFSAVLALNYGWCAFTVARQPSAPPGTGAPDLRVTLRALPAQEYPHTTAVAEALADYGGDDQYTRALALLIRGVATAATA
jgi:AcrR family transcriptional regulator